MSAAGIPPWGRPAARDAPRGISEAGAGVPGPEQAPPVAGVESAAVLPPRRLPRSSHHGGSAPVHLET